MTLDEQQLIRQVLSGRTDSFRGLVERYQGPVFRFVRNLVPNLHDCEDITQDVFLTGMSQLVSYDSRQARFLTWLLTIARNKCINHLKRKRPSYGENGLGLTNERTPVQEASEQEFHQRLDNALAELSLEQRTAFVLAEFEGLTYATVAQIEQTKVGTVKSRIARAKQHLRSVLKHELEQP